ncbi:MAG: hypothetical protein ACJ79L_11790 [Anaeromyxobacteraceae bacterium]
MSALLLALALGAGSLPGYPLTLGAPVSQHAVGALLDGAPALVVVAGDRVVALRVDGASVRGYPVPLGKDEVASGAPAAGDLDGDGRVEIAVVTLSGKVVVLGGGAPVPGFPARLGAKARAGASFVDVDGDGRPEVVVGDAAGKLHAFKRGGKEAAGFPVTLGSAVTSTASASRFGGAPSLAVGCADGRVHVLDLASRKERRGFPLETAYEVTGAPAFADVDGDGAMDLVVASQDFKLYAVSDAGKALPGFPVEAGYRLYEGPAIGDLDGDGKVAIAFTSADGLLHVVDGNGRPRTGFPVRVGTRIFGGAVIGDLDRDGRPDVAAVSADGNVVAVSADGANLAGFPTRLDASDLGATPLLHDLAGDASLSIFIGFPGGELHAIRALRFGSVAATAPWPSPGHDAAHAGRHGPNPPRYHALAIEPAAPRTGDGLKARWRWVALDARPGEPEPPPRIAWYRNGALAGDLEGKPDVPPGRARKGEVWRFALTPQHGAVVYRGPEVRIGNTPPATPAVTLDPPRPARGRPVRLALGSGAADADGDKVAYRYEWLLDGLPAGVTADTFPGERLAKGVLLTARVYATDGESEAEPAVVEARVADSAPGPVAVALAPAVPHRDDVLSARLGGAAIDADGDAVTYRYRWKVNGAARNLPLAAAALPARALRKGQKVSVEVRAFDGELEGPPAVADAVVANSAPGAPALEIRPRAPHKGEALRAVLLAEALDADGDALRYHYAWSKNGKPLAVAGDARAVPASEVARGDHFEVTVFADDGEAEGPRASAAVEVKNAPPTAPRVAIRPERPKGGEALRAEVVQPSVDADGDAIRYAYAWSKDGKAIPGATGEVLSPELFAKHQRVRVTVTPSDPAGPGAAASAEVEVTNAVPGAPVVSLAPERPSASTPLVARLATPAADADRDALVYRYRWLRDGFAVAVPDGREASAREPFWTGATEVPAEKLKKGQRWTVEAQAFDGEAYGPLARATVTVVNTPPPPPRIALAPAAPRRGDGLRVQLEAAPDADGDAVSYRYAWTRDGQRAGDGAEVARGVPRKRERWHVEVVASDGEAESAPVAAEVVVANSPPGAPAVALCDAPVRAGTALEAKLRAPTTDADGDAVSYRYAFTVGGRPAASASGARLPASSVRKHDLVRVVATASDGEVAGAESAAECAVENSPPSAPEIALDPAEPSAATGIRARIARPATDGDGDPVSYRYAWYRDGVAAGVEGAEVPRGVPRHGETWRVVVRAFDGEEEGEPVSATATVRNTPPPAPAVALRPEAPVTGQALTCDAHGPEVDADGEPVEVRYRWLRDGAPTALGEAAASLPAGLVRRGERWRCEAWTSDGTAESARAGAEALVKNSPPGAPQVVVEPEAPRRGDALVCRIAAEAPDPDGDALTYRYAWSKDGAPAPPGADPAHVAADRLRKGQRWRCAVTANDGAADGASAQAERTIANSPPGPAQARVTPDVPRPGAPLRCEVVHKAEDPDGDPVHYLFSWVRNGEPQGFAAGTDEVPVRLVRPGDRWRCVVTATDGDASGPPTGSPEVLVRPAAEERLSRDTGSDRP